MSRDPPRALPKRITLFLASKSGSSPRTVETYEKLLRSYLKWHDWDPKIDRTSYDAYIGSLRAKGRKQNGIVTASAALRGYAAHRGSNTTEWQVPKPEEVPRESLRPSEIEMLRRAAMESHHHEDKIFVVDFLLGTGLRVEEFLELRWSDVDIEAKKLVVRRGKESKSREIPLTKTARLAAIEYLRYVYGSQGDPAMARLIPDRVAPVTTRQAVSRMLQALASKAGLQARNLHPHLLRHSYAHLVEPIVGMRALQAILGHSSLETTARYTQISAMRDPRVKGLVNLDITSEPSGEAVSERD
jgi:integrase/recombinase XerD